jgi:geranylgeranyl pyrophosphate synthase
MAPEKKLIEQVAELLKKRGQKALQLAKESILQENIEFEPLQEALRYFMEEIWEDVLHPALLSLACEAVGGNPESTTHVGAALVLLAGGADVHDDIIDQSTIKDSKQTVFGKFGTDITLLVGDALLFKGLYMLHDACETLPKNQKHSILELAKHAFFEIGTAEAKEAIVKKKLDLSAEEYLNIIEMKVRVAEATVEMGAVLGNGTSGPIKAMGKYGKTLGMLMTIRDEFIDIFEPEELRNRVEKECLPLPILFTFKDSEKKKEITQLLREGNITEKTVDQILELVMEAKEILELKEEMLSLIGEGIQQLSLIKRCKGQLQLLLKSAIEDL